MKVHCQLIALLMLLLLSSACAPGIAPAPAPAEATMLVPTEPTAEAPTPESTVEPIETTDPGPTETTAPIPTDTTVPAPTETTDPGPVLTEGTLVTDWYANLNPWTGCCVPLGDLIFNPLVELKDNYREIQPGVAEQWEVNEDLTKWTFHLRQDVKWHDGIPLGAHDVAFTYNALLRDEMSGWKSDLLKKLSVLSIEVVDDYTIQIITEIPAASLLGALSAIWILPEHVWKDVNIVESFGEGPIPGERLIGSGAFRVAALSAEEIRLEYNPDFFRGKPNLEAIVALQLFDDGMKAMRFEQGELHILGVYTPELFRWVWQNTNASFLGSNAPTTWYIMVNQQKPDLVNRSFREGLICAVDREKLVDLTYKNQEFSSWSWTPSRLGDSFEYDASNPEPEFICNYDPEKAKELLADSGWDFQQELTFIVPQDPVHQEMAQIFKEFWQTVGLTINVAPVPWSILSDSFRSGDWQLMYAPGWIAEPDSTWIWQWTPLASWVVSTQVNIQVEQLGKIGFGWPIEHGAERWTFVEDSPAPTIRPDLTKQPADLIRQNIDELRRTLAQYGLTTGDININASAGFPSDNNAFQAAAPVWQFPGSGIEALDNKIVAVFFIRPCTDDVRCPGQIFAIRTNVKDSSKGVIEANFLDRNGEVIATTEAKVEILDTPVDPPRVSFREGNSHCLQVDGDEVSFCIPIPWGPHSGG